MGKSLTVLIKAFQGALVIMIIIAAFTSCSGKSNKQGSHIPKDAMMAFVVNGKSFFEKLTWEEIKRNPAIVELYSDSSVTAYLKSVLDNPDNTGIDINNDMVFFLQKDSAGGYFAMEGVIKSADKFKTFFSNIHKGSGESKTGDLNHLVDKLNTVTWNDERFVIITDIPQFRTLGRYGEQSNMDMIATRDGKALSASLMKLKKENSLGTEKRFSEIISEKGDMHFWINIGAINAASMAASPMSMLNISKLYEDMAMAGAVNFEEGKVSVDARSYYGDEMYKLMKKYKPSSLNRDMVKSLPMKDVAFVLAMNMNPQFLKELTRLAGVEGMVNMSASQLGVSLDDLVKAWKGDLVFGISELMTDTTNPVGTKMVFGLSVNDRASFNKIIGAGEKIMGVDKVPGKTPPVAYGLNEKLFALGSDKASVDNYMSQSSKNNYSFLEKFGESYAGVYVDFQNIFKGLRRKASSDSVGMQMLDASIATWDNAIATAGNMKEKVSPSHFEVNLLDKKSNSLKTLNNYIGAMAVLAKKKTSKREELWNRMSDTTVALPADPVQPAY